MEEQNNLEAESKLEEPSKELVEEEEEEKDSEYESYSDSEGSVRQERESGDGQESIPNKKVDDDEDKKNPQYIPKRGTFYEHDDRTAEDEVEVTVPEVEKEQQQKKKVWNDKKEKWNHDKFNDSEQAPKSRAELVSIYGYDIRNEDGPPRARRRRRYGRGPNKYTRNWEDEDAYSKPPPARPKKPVPKPQDFPPLENESPQNSKVEENNDNVTLPTNNEVPSASQEPLNSEINRNQQQQQQLPPQQQQQQQRVGSGRVIKPKREIKDSDYHGFTTKTRQVRNIKTDQKVYPKQPQQQQREEVIQTQNFTNKNMQDLEQDLSKINLNESKSSKRQGSVPPRLQTDQKNSKRYSSIRQRSLPESAAPPFNQPPNYFNEFNQSQVNIHPSTPQIAPPPLPPVAATPILPPPQFSPFPQQFLPPAPPFIPQQTPIINYVGQPQFAYQQQFNQSQPEIFQPPTGITYYSTDQQVGQRAVLKRPKAAIPIVPPPPIDLKGRPKEDDLSAYEGDVSGMSETGDSAQDVTQETTWNLQAINSSHFNR